jgi:uncharacterized protein DUF397
VIWVRSSHCADTTCAEVAFDGPDTLLRATENPDHVLRFGREAWRAFMDGTRSGEFDLPKEAP